MGKVYDDWGRLVEAVLRREKLRQLCYAQSMSSSDSSCRLDADFSHLHAEMAMVRLQEDLIYTLTQNKQCFEHGYASLPTFEMDPMYTSPEHSSSSKSEDCVLDLLNPDMIPKLKAIASKMFALNYDGEFCEVFVRLGRGAFAVYLEILGVEEVSFENVQEMDWNSLNSKIRKWHFAINTFILLYLTKAKLLFDQVLGEHGQVIRSTCLVEASKPSLMWFLSLGCRVAIGPHKPEWLFCLLDMHQELVPLIPSVEALFPDKVGSCIRVEFHNLLTRLQDSAKVILMKLGNALCPFSSDPFPFPNGGVHSLTKCVVNYMLRFAKYDCIIADEEDATDEQSISGAMAAHLHSVTSALEASIANMSDLYQDTSLKHIFVMNNIHYMVAKINSSKIKAHFGDKWIKKQTVNFRFHALSYQGSTWSFVLPLLRDYGSDVYRANLKAKYRDFIVGFENVYKNQTGWHVPNVELREEIRNAASTIVVPAYRILINSIMNGYFRDKHIKYSAYEMETLMQDLLEGSSKSLSHRV